MKKLRLASLFSGCGGMDLGFEGNFSINPKSYQNTKQSKLPALNISTIFACDINHYTKTVWEHNFSKRKNIQNIYHCESIVDIVKNMRNKKIPIPKNIDIVTGGFPCNDFSRAGSRKGFSSNKSHTGHFINDPTIENRGILYYWMKEFISLVKPKVFYAENVKGLTDFKTEFEIICSDFNSINNSSYHLEPIQIINAVNFGVPQNRERIIFIGFNKNFFKKKILQYVEENKKLPDNLSPYPKNTHGKDQLPFVTTKDALEDLNEPENEKIDKSQQHYSKAKFLKNSGQGQNEINPNKPSPTIRAEHHGNIEFRRLSHENGGKNLLELSKNYKERRLTVRECARLQTFPDDFDFVIPDKKISASQSYRMIGNAVPPLLGYHLAKRLSEIWSEIFINKN